MPKFEKTYCSSCGQEFGPGDHGFSHCEDHGGMPDDLVKRLRWITKNDSGNGWTPDIDEAADEIKRLREERDKAIALLRERNHRKTKNFLAALKQE